MKRSIIALMLAAVFVFGSAFTAGAAEMTVNTEKSATALEKTPAAAEVAENLETVSAYNEESLMSAASVQELSPNVNTHTKEDIIRYMAKNGFTLAYSDEYENMPNSSATNAGTLTKGTLNSGLVALNTVRYIAGLDEVTLDSTYNEYCQAGAYVNYLNKILTHTPEQPTGMPDSLYQKGYLGCSSSNIAWGPWTLAGSIVYGYVRDTSVDSLGHRRWCLNPEMGKTGFGKVGSYSNMYAFDQSNTAASQGYVVWPAQVTPIEFFYNEKWSLSTGESVKSAAVKIQAGSKIYSSTDGTIELSINNGGYGQTGCIIFNPINLKADTNTTYRVTVDYKNNSGEQIQVNYDVNFFTLEGIHNIDGEFYYFDDSGSLASLALDSGWQKIDGSWYYFNSSTGKFLTGWQKIDGSWYYLEPSTGAASMGWQKIGGYWYYFKTGGSGKMLTGWQKIGNCWYYFDTSTGRTAMGWKKISGSWYYFKEGGSGKMLTGWQKVNNSWYYLNPGTGKMLTGWQKIDGSWYYMDTLTGKVSMGWKKISGSWYYFKEGGSGKMLTGWQKVGGYWYYLTPGSGVLKTGWQKIDGYWYYLKPGNSGRMYDGFQQIDGNYYYFIGGKMQTGFKKINGKWHYFNTGNSGRMLTGWQTINGSKYYFDPVDYGTMATGTKTIDGKQYVFNSNGKLANIYYVANINSGKLHLSTCKNLPGKDNSAYFATIDEALNAGYTDKCENCLK